MVKFKLTFADALNDTFSYLDAETLSCALRMLISSHGVSRSFDNTFFSIQPFSACIHDSLCTQDSVG